VLQISYYDEKQKSLKGVIQLLDVEEIEYLPSKRIGARFDIRSKGEKPLQLNGNDPDDTQQWIWSLKEAFK